MTGRERVKHTYAALYHRSFMLFLSCFVMLSCSLLLMPCGNLLGKSWSLGSRLWCLIVSYFVSEPCTDPEGGQGALTPPPPPPPPLKNHKTVGFLSNTGPDPLKITKLPSQHPMLGHLWPTFSGIWIPTRLPSLTKKNPNKHVRVEPPLTKFSGSPHVSLNLQILHGIL